MVSNPKADQEKELEQVLPHVARGSCKELLTASMENIAKLGAARMVEITKNLKRSAESQPAIEQSQLKQFLDSVDFDPTNIWEVPVQDEKWASIPPIWQPLVDSVPDGESVDDYQDVLMHMLALRFVFELKQLENKFIAGGTTSYESFMAGADEHIAAINHLATFLKGKDQALKHFDRRLAQYRAGRNSGVQRSEAQQELMDAVLEEAILMKANKRADSARDAARMILMDWQGNDAKRHWFKDEAGNYLYDDLEGAIRREIEAKGIYPKRRPGRPKKNSN